MNIIYALAYEQSSTTVSCQKCKSKSLVLLDPNTEDYETCADKIPERGYMPSIIKICDDNALIIFCKNCTAVHYACTKCSILEKGSQICSEHPNYRVHYTPFKSIQPVLMKFLGCDMEEREDQGGKVVYRLNKRLASIEEQEDGKVYEPLDSSTEEMLDDLDPDEYEIQNVPEKDIIEDEFRLFRINYYVGDKNYYYCSTDVCTTPTGPDGGGLFYWKCMQCNSIECYTDK